MKSFFTIYLAKFFGTKFDLSSFLEIIGLITVFRRTRSFAKGKKNKGLVAASNSLNVLGIPNLRSSIMSESQTVAGGILPKTHSLMARPDLLGRAPSSQSDDDEDDAEDLSLDLVPGENWMSLTTTNYLCASQSSVSTRPVEPYAAIQPWSRSLLSSSFSPPSLHPGDEETLKGSFLMIDIDDQYCTVKDIRIKLPSKNHEGADNSHYRFSICRPNKHSWRLPSTWDHVSFTRRLFHLQEGDKLVLWETSNTDPSSKPTSADLRCVWEKAYQAIVETDTDDGDFMVSQLEMDMTQTQDVHHQTAAPQDQMVLTQPSIEQSLTQKSPPLLTQPESPKKPDADRNEEDDDDSTIDPRLGKPAIAKPIIGANKTGKPSRNSENTETQQSLQADLKQCIEIASEIRERKDLLETPKTKPSRPLVDTEQIRSPDLLDDSSVEDDKNGEKATDQKTLRNLEDCYDEAHRKVSKASVSEEKKEDVCDSRLSNQRDSQETVTESESSFPTKEKTKSNKTNAANESSSQIASPTTKDHFEARSTKTVKELRNRDTPEAKETVGTTETEDKRVSEFDVCTVERIGASSLPAADNEKHDKNNQKADEKIDREDSSSPLQDASGMEPKSKDSCQSDKSDASSKSAQLSIHQESRVSATQTPSELADKSQDRKTESAPSVEDQKRDKAHTQGVTIAANTVVSLGAPSDVTHTSTTLESRNAGNPRPVEPETEKQSASTFGAVEERSKSVGNLTDEQSSVFVVDKQDKISPPADTSGQIPLSGAQNQGPDKDMKLSLTQEMVCCQQKDEKCEKVQSVGDSQPTAASSDRKRLLQESCEEGNATTDVDLSTEKSPPENKLKPVEGKMNLSNEPANVATLQDEEEEPSDGMILGETKSQQKRVRARAKSGDKESPAQSTRENSLQARKSSRVKRQKRDDDPFKASGEPSSVRPENVADDNPDASSTSQRDRNSRWSTRHTKMQHKTEPPEDSNEKKRKQQSPDATSASPRRRTITNESKSTKVATGKPRASQRRISGDDEPEDGSDKVYLLITGGDILSEMEKQVSTTVN